MYIFCFSVCDFSVFADVTKELFYCDNVSLTFLMIVIVM